LAGEFKFVVSWVNASNVSIVQTVSLDTENR